MAPRYAPGWPGVTPRWTSSAKLGIGTALRTTSRVWFTLAHGILNEIYYPRIDQACTRDCGLIVTDGAEFFSEEKRHTKHEVALVADGIPAYHLTNTCRQGRYRIEKDVIADPWREVVLQRVRFTPLQGARADYHLYVLVAPHLGNQGMGNTAWIGDEKGVPMLFAQRDSSALALGSSAPWRARSVGFVGFSDGWQDLVQHKQLAWRYDRAENGNVALVGEIDLAASDGEFVLALGLGARPAEAGHQVLASLYDRFEDTRAEYIADWENWQRSLLHLEPKLDGEKDLYRTSMMVLRAHEAKEFTGGLIASLSIPWGQAKGDSDLAGYHLVWTRDLVESVGGFMAAGASVEARRVLRYLQTTQEPDGHWSQNMWLDGSPYWTGVQLDEAGFPILLAVMAWREGIISVDELDVYWPMVRRAAGFIARTGPATPQDRWEEDAGYSPFTLAVEIAALVAAAELAELVRNTAAAEYLRDTADAWNAGVERWTYVKDTDLARKVGVEGYYVRIAPPDANGSPWSPTATIPIKNRPPDQSAAPAASVVSPDALALVRFGLRAADDPRIVNTVKVIDALLRVETPQGPAWHRYNHDGYGEHEDGAPFDGIGVGRAWPLLTGERAHYELAAGHLQEAARLLTAMGRFANEGGLIPEQVWDAPDLPDKRLFCGRPSGSAMPLVWAHSEYVKLCRSLHETRVFDTHTLTARRYLAEREAPARTAWRFTDRVPTLPAGHTLRVETLAPALVHWSADGWKTAEDAHTTDTTLGIHYADLPTTQLPPGTEVLFTFYWPDESRWEGADMTVKVEG